MEVKISENKCQIKENGNINDFKLNLISKDVLSFENNNQIRNLTYYIKDNTVFLYKNGKEYKYEFLDDKAIRRLSSSGGLNQGGPLTIEAPMPGKIIKVFKSVGEKVKKGEAVIIMEAMKMENEMKAPYDGVITDVFVSVNNTVESGAKLFSIE